MLKIVLTLTLLSAIFALPNEGETIHKILDSFENRSVKDLFKVWHLLFKRSYTLDSQEAISRFRIFKDNLKFIRDNNAQNNGLTLGLNQFSDLTNDEYRKLYLDNTIASKVEQMTRETEAEDIILGEWQPKQMSQVGNYTAFNHSKYFPPTRNQGSCGSCWAFSTVGAIEAQYALNNNITNNSLYLSPQQLVDCDAADNGCNGGWMDKSFNYVINSGVTLERNYPYRAVAQRCAQQNITRDVNVTAFKSCNPKSCGLNNTFYNLLRQGPLSVVIDAGTREFQMYRSGIMPTTTCRNVNHAIIAVGYGIHLVANKPTPMWIVRNSWGSTWGQKGDAFIAFTPNRVGGSCFVDQYGWLALLN